MLASETGTPAVVKALLAAGANIEAKTEVGAKTQRDAAWL